MEVNENSVKRWMEVCSINKHVEKLEELQEFLNLLWIWILEKNNPRDVLQHIPSVGKFLGKMTTNPTVLTSEELFKNLLKCVLSLRYLTGCDGHGNISKGTRIWTQAQVRNVSTPIYNDSSVLAVAELCGYTAEETTQFIVKKMGESLATEISSTPSYCWTSSASECVPQMAVEGENLHQISEMCVPLVGLPASKPFVEALLCCTKNTDIVERGRVTEALSPKFLEAVSEISQSGENDHKRDETAQSLTAKADLWKRCPHSFETEVLNLLEKTTVKVTGLSREEMTDIVSGSELCQACADCPQLCIYAWQILRLTLVETLGNMDVLNLMEVFRQSCIDASHSSSCASSLRLERIFDQQRCS